MRQGIPWNQGSSSCAGPFIPERDLRCIFEAILFGDNLGAAMAVGFVEEATDCVDISTVIKVTFLRTTMAK
jgi:hypothetical protein